MNHEAPLRDKSVYRLKSSKGFEQDKTTMMHQEHDKQDTNKQRTLNVSLAGRHKLCRSPPAIAVAEVSEASESPKYHGTPVFDSRGQKSCTA